MTDDTTNSVTARWAYTNDVLAGFYLLAYIVLTGLAGHGLIDLSVIPVFWRTTVVTIALIATVWLFGVDAFKAVLEYKR